MIENLIAHFMLFSSFTEDELDEEARDHIEAQARLLYGLVHARYIITTRGLGKMVSYHEVAGVDFIAHRHYTAGQIQKSRLWQMSTSTLLSTTTSTSRIV